MTVITSVMPPMAPATADPVATLIQIKGTLEQLLNVLQQQLMTNGPTGGAAPSLARAQSTAGADVAGGGKGRGTATSVCGCGDAAAAGMSVGQGKSGGGKAYGATPDYSQQQQQPPMTSTNYAPPQQNAPQYSYAVSSRERAAPAPMTARSYGVASKGLTPALEQAFQRASQKHGVPVALLKAVARAESGFRSDAVSPAGAQGLMQLMPATGRGLGVTNPFDPEQSIDAGARYLKEGLKKFGGDERLALAAYNAGPGAVKKHGGIPPYKETQEYVRKVMDFAGQFGSMNA